MGWAKTTESFIGQLLFSLWVQCNDSDTSNHNFFPLSSSSHPIHLARDASSPSPQTLHFEHSITFGCCPVCVETSCLSSRENKKLESSWVNKRKKNPIFYFYIWKLFMVCYNNSGWLHVYFWYFIKLMNFFHCVCVHWYKLWLNCNKKEEFNM